MASYPQSVLDEIRAAVDIVDVVNRFVNLKKAGQNWKGLCPFHTEKTPSFMVNEKKGIFHCFGCGVGGDAFGFLMRQDKLSFPEAVRALPKQAGGAAPREGRSGVYDRFRGRLLFAIRDLQGRVVAFGGRAFGDEQPKYLNSPETPLYVKGNLLYAADLARAAIQAKNRAVLVEGYVDCLMAHQHGFTETVAALGTAFTPAQLGLLKRYCDEAVLFFDADAAGRKAAERAEELLEPTGSSMAWAVNRTRAIESPAALRLRLALLPGGHGPGPFPRDRGAGARRDAGRDAPIRRARPGRAPAPLDRGAGGAPAHDRGGRGARPWPVPHDRRGPAAPAPRPCGEPDDQPRRRRGAGRPGRPPRRRARGA